MLLDPVIDHSIIESELQKLSKQDLIRLILQTQPTEAIPVTAFTTTCSPLESICRYLSEHNKRVSEIAKLLNRKQSSISEALKNSKQKRFNPKKTQTFIALSAFTENQFSILESIVFSLRRQGMKFSQIAQLLERDPKTIWTVHSRAKMKLALGTSPRGDKMKKKFAKKRGDPRGGTRT